MQKEKKYQYLLNPAKLGSEQLPEITPQQNKSS